MHELTECKIKAFYEHGIRTSRNTMIGGRSLIYCIIENILCENSEAAAGLMLTNEGVSIVRESSGMPIDENNIIPQVQNAVLNFTAQYAKIFGDYFPNLEFDKFGVFDIVYDLVVTPNKKDAHLLRGVNWAEPSFIGCDSSVYDDWYAKHFTRVKSARPNQTSLKERLRVWGYHTAEKYNVLVTARKIWHTIFKPNKGVNIKDTIRQEVDAALDKLRNDANYFGQGNNIIFTGNINEQAYKMINSVAASMNSYHWIYLTCNIVRLQSKLVFSVYPFSDIFSKRGFTLQVKK